MKLSFVSHSQQHTTHIGKDLGNRVRLSPEWGKVILLVGELGAGKTTFATGFFEGIGALTTAKSPTFTYIQEHELSGGIKAVHIDLYRLSDDPTARAMIVEQIEEYVDEGVVIFVEWANLLMEDIELLTRESAVEIIIAQSKNEDERELTVNFYNDGSIGEQETLELMEYYQTPVHVRKHIEKVTYVATEIAQKLYEKGVLVDRDLVKNGALCHDLVRYVDFPNFDDLSHYQEEVTPEKLQTWKSTQQQFAHTHHGAAIGEILREKGYYATAEVCEAHMTKSIFREKPFSWEEKIVYYADKRALHDQIVSLKQRFADGQKRYGHDPNSGLEERVFAIEEEIFGFLDIEPEDIC